jgi:hypothetical protein
MQDPGVRIAVFIRIPQAGMVPVIQVVPIRAVNDRVKADSPKWDILTKYPL